MSIASYARLKSGTWGLRVKGLVGVGDRLVVTTRGGRTRNEVVKGIVWRQGDISLCEIEAAKRRSPRSRSQAQPRPNS